MRKKKKKKKQKQIHRKSEKKKKKVCMYQLKTIIDRQTNKFYRLIIVVGIKPPFRKKSIVDNMHPIVTVTIKFFLVFFILSQLILLFQILSFFEKQVIQEEEKKHLTFHGNDFGNFSADICSISSRSNDCGYFGISESECYSRNCCWRPTNEENVNWCFYKEGNHYTCNINEFDRIPCGFEGVNEYDCINKFNCCWDDDDDNPINTVDDDDNDDLDHIKRNINEDLHQRLGSSSSSSSSSSKKCFGRKQKCDGYKVKNFKKNLL